MVLSLNAQPDPEPPTAIVPGMVETLGVEVRLPAPRAADHDTPIFLLLRLTVGLPSDDGRWWPEVEDFAVPSLTVLERMLVGLRAWDPTAGVAAVHSPGRHRRVAG